MKSEIIQKPSALVLMASRLSVEPEKMKQTLKDTVFKGASDSELLALVVIANEYGLNPLLREIYAFPAKGGGITPVVSIDGWISMVNRQPQLDGLEFEFEDQGNNIPCSCTCTIYIKNRSHPVRVTEFYDECYRNTDPWKQMPRRMLRHKALKEAARVAFGFSGITDEDEANDIKPASARIVRSVTKPNFSKEPAPEIKAVKGGASGESEVAGSAETSGDDGRGETDAMPGGVAPDEQLALDEEDAAWLAGKEAK
jgi:phage recombination protein Bet